MAPTAAAKYITTYFRQTFNVSDPSLFQSLTLSLVRDDGAVVYLNGTEVFRTNMPTGTIAYNTTATSAIEETTDTTSVNPALLQAGSNVLAVEIHQANGTSSDISFDAAARRIDVNAAAHAWSVPSNRHAVERRRPVAHERTEQQPRDLRAQIRPVSILSATDAAITTEHVVTLSGLSAEHAVLLRGRIDDRNCSRAGTRTTRSSPRRQWERRYRRASGCSAIPERPTRTRRPCATRTTASPGPRSRICG